jgi:glucan phosphoethanolaminetransferase (alkaline phosphatase superfamily)
MHISNTKKFILFSLGLIGYLFLLDPSTYVVLDNIKVIIPKGNEFFYTRPVVVVLCWVATIIGLVTALNLRSPSLRRLSWSVFLLASLMNYISYELSGSAFNVNQYELILSEVSHATSFVSGYRHLIFIAIGKWVVLSSLFSIFAYLIGPILIKKKWANILLAVALVMAVINLMRYKAVTNGINSFYAVPGSIIYKYFTGTYYGPREELKTTPIEAPKVDHIILIVDESVRDDYLSINNKELDTTPFLSSINIVNYGTAVSAGNSSRHSNLVMRNGLIPKEIPDRAFYSLKKPNIFQYSKNAGFRTVYTNAQRTGQSFDNFMNKFDLTYIDHFENVAGILEDSKESGDAAIVNVIANAVDKSPKTFIYANKIGVHFPYANRYPLSETYYTPAHLPGESQTDLEKTKNAYKNGIRWAVDKFFQNLLAKLKGKNYLIIYVSDHGENLDQAERCSGHGSLINASSLEAKIPLIVFSDNPKLLEQFKNNLENKFNKSSQFDVFPTVLWALGYDPKWISTTFGPNLLSSEAYERKFYSGSIHHTGHWNNFMTEYK